MFFVRYFGDTELYLNGILLNKNRSSILNQGSSIRSSKVQPIYYSDIVSCYFADDNAEKIYNFGRLLGVAFQLQDDYLDAFGDPETFGKQIGGDIIENKKTFLYLKALELSDEQTSKKLKFSPNIWLLI